MKPDCLIIEGGGFKTAFTAGVIDAFIINNYNPFQKLIGISGGAVALSYYLSKQYRFSINALRYLSTDKEFRNYRRTFSDKGYLNIDHLATVASEKVPFEMSKALEANKNREIFFVATDKENCCPAYLRPNRDNWIHTVIASSTLPFATKGVHNLDGVNYFDGGWSDPLVLRTRPKDFKLKQSWADYFGSKYFKSIPNLSKTFEKSHELYNDSVDLMMDPPKGLTVKQISPKFLLKSGTYSYSKSTLMLDYRYGLDKGSNYLNKIRTQE